jgi:hypothetical protein
MNRLHSADIERYRRDGVLFPLSAFNPAEIAEYYDAICAMENARAGRLPPLLNFKLHLLVPWLWDMIHDARIVDPVEDILGPDIVCWEASFVSKPAGDPAHTSWHQDAPYRGLSDPDGATAWVAFTASDRRNGCVRVLPGTHRTELPHRGTADPASMLPAREVVAGDVDERQAIDIVLKPGEMSLHHPLTIHNSQPNRSRLRRLGYAIRYVPGYVSQRGERGTATLVRGRDHGTFDLEERPSAVFDDAAMARHTVLFRRWMRIVYTEIRARRV